MNILSQFDAAIKSFAPHQSTSNVPTGIGALDSGRVFVLWSLSAGGPIFDTSAEAMCFIIAHHAKFPHSGRIANATGNAVNGLKAFVAALEDVQTHFPDLKPKSPHPATAEQGDPQAA